jgi:hypothetical protein
MKPLFDINISYADLRDLIKFSGVLVPKEKEDKK